MRTLARLLRAVQMRVQSALSELHLARHSRVNVSPRWLNCRFVERVQICG
jgi:hypothetical protein